jgi:type IV secretion system protein VirB6
VGFFATFWAWLNGQMATYVGDNTARLASVLEPGIVTLATVYVMAWGYLNLTGKIEEPFRDGLKRILLLALILGAGLHLWLYNTVIVDTFYNAPAQLAAAVVGAADPVATIDTIWERGGEVGGSLWARGSAAAFGEGVGFHIAAAVVWCFMGLLCVYSMFLIALSNIALAVLLALGPLFIAMLLFDATKRLFAAWIAQLVNYALITVITVMVGALLLQIVKSYATQTAALGSALLTVDALHMVLIAVLVFLLLRQVMPIAAGLAGGVALSSMGFVSRGVGMAVRSTRRDGGKAAEPMAVYSAPGTSRGIRGLPAWAGRVVRHATGNQFGRTDKP